MGCTPEILFELIKKGNRTTVKTVACAGTAPRGSCAHLTGDEKSLKEHQIVVEGIVEGLLPLGPVTIGSQEVRSLSHLSHLITPIELNTGQELQFLDLVSAIHPTAALGAFPKLAGQDWLRACNARLERGRFGAPAGYLKPNGEGFAVVGIRNIQWGGHGVKIGAGCGVVAESRPEEEWAELELKIQSVKRIFHI